MPRRQARYGFRCHGLGAAKSGSRRRRCGGNLGQGETGRMERRIGLPNAALLGVAHRPSNAPMPSPTEGRDRDAAAVKDLRACLKPGHVAKETVLEKNGSHDTSAGPRGEPSVVLLAGAEPYIPFQPRRNVVMRGPGRVNAKTTQFADAPWVVTSSIRSDPPPSHPPSRAGTACRRVPSGAGLGQAPGEDIFPIGEGSHQRRRCSALRTCDVVLHTICGPRCVTTRGPLDSSVTMTRYW